MQSPADPAPIAGKRVLVVDDEPWIAEILSAILTEDGHQVDTADEGLLALGMLQLAPYDLVLCDVRMPGLDGPGLYAEIERSQPEMLGRILFVTGNRFTPEVGRFIERTGVPALQKPFGRDEVTRVTQAMLRRGIPSLSSGA